MTVNKYAEVSNISAEAAAVLTVLTPASEGEYAIKRHLLALPDASDSQASLLANIPQNGSKKGFGEVTGANLNDKVYHLVKGIMFSNPGIIHSGTSTIARIVGLHDSRQVDTGGTVTLNEKFYSEGDLVFVTPVKVATVPYVRKDALSLSGWVVCDTRQKDTHNTFVVLGKPPLTIDDMPRGHAPIMRLTKSLPHNALFEAGGSLRIASHAKGIADAKGSYPFTRVDSKFSTISVITDPEFEVLQDDDGMIAYPVWVTLTDRVNK
jgi:hypothetical protein